MRDGEFFGKMSLLDGHARRPTRLRKCVPAWPFRGLNSALSCERIRILRSAILTALTHRLRRTDDLLRHRVSRNANEEDAARRTFATARPT